MSPDTKNDMGDPVLFTAMKGGHVNRVRLLIDAGADVNVRNHFGTPALIEAIRERYVDVVKLLLDAGADADMRDGWGRSTLVTAVSLGYEPREIEMVRMLLDAGATVNLQRGDSPALFEAVTGNNIAAARLLLASGAHVNGRGSSGETALFQAARSILVDVDMLELLLTAGAEVNIRNYAGQSPLMIACSTKKPPFIALLLDAGARINAERRGGAGRQGQHGPDVGLHRRK
jgi:hypothetical protein